MMSGIVRVSAPLAGLALAAATLSGCDLLLDDGGDGVVVLTDRGEVSAFGGDVSTTLWSTSLPAADFGDLAVDAGVVYQMDDGSKVTALDADSGDELWSTDIGGAAVGRLEVLGGRLFVQTADDVVCLDADSGAEQWSQPFAGLAGAMVTGDGALFVAGDPVRRLDVASGDGETSFPMGDSAVADIAYSGGLVVVGGRFEVVGLSPSGLDEQWRVELDDASTTGMVADAGDIYVATDNDGVLGLDSADGGEFMHALAGWALDPPAFAGGKLYVAESFGEVVRVEPSDGSEDWSWPSSEDHRGGIDVVGATVYLADGGALVGLDADSGTAEWEQSPGGTILALSLL